MTHCSAFQTNTFLQEFGNQSFDDHSQAVGTRVVSVLILSILAIILAVFLAFEPLNASARAADQSAALGKSDRIESDQTGNCNGVARRACGVSLSENITVRKVGFVTIDRPSTEPNTSNLVRVPRGS
ncbi:hypothetical protein [Roseibium algae]|uniref:Uncharacterized protein n=1 Tax=Roseibium algae TaxID=3123038 RepID=A0ABU8TQF0_9HYPH